MEAIEILGHDLTILIIAHRLTTLKNCTQVVEKGYIQPVASAVVYPFLLWLRVAEP